MKTGCCVKSHLSLDFQIVAPRDRRHDICEICSPYHNRKVIKFNARTIASEILSSMVVMHLLMRNDPCVYGVVAFDALRVTWMLVILAADSQKELLFLWRVDAQGGSDRSHLHFIRSRRREHIQNCIL